MTTQAPSRRTTWHDAYDAQMALWRWTRPGQPGESWLFQSYQENAKALDPETAKLLMTLYVHENAKLLQADPIFVSAEMCEVVEAAAESFQPEPLLPTDLLTAFGFLYFERPFEVPDRFDKPITIQAVSWAPVLGDPSRAEGFAENPQDVLRYFQGRDYVDFWENDDNHVVTAEEAQQAEGIAMTIYASRSGHEFDLSVPDVVPMHVTPWWFGMGFEGNEVDEKGKPTGAVWWWKIVQSTFRLMQQQLAVRRQERPDRPTRRNAARYGFLERDVVVVRLRRESETSHEPPGEDANYSHRFIVSGHWRNQWYPASKIHRQIWVSPYIKGDRSLPLVIRPRRVYNWSK